MKNLFCSLFLVSSLSVTAQGVPNDYVSLNQELQKIGYEEGENTEDLAGSPFWKDEFIPGEILRDGEKEIEAYFRYNVLSDQVEIKVKPSEEEYYLLPRWGDLEYQTQEYSLFLSHKITDDQRSLYGYFMKYFEGDEISFYGKPTAEILPAQRAETSYDQGRPATILVKSHFYVQIGDEPVREVRIKEKDFRRLFGEGKSMRKYFKEHKIKEIEDVVSMLQFYEEVN